VGCVIEFESKVECVRITGRRRGDPTSMTMKLEHLKVTGKSVRANARVHFRSAKNNTKSIV